MRMKNILVAIDFSKSTPLIIEKAVELALAFKAKIWLVHVARPSDSQINMNLTSQDIPGLNAAGASYYRDLLDINEARKIIAAELRDEHNKLLDISKEISKQGISIQGLLLEGAESLTLIRETEKLKADLVVMGSHRHGMIHKLFLGSISEGVMKNSQVPVMIIPVS